ncbi:hypothetical protein FACS1894147_11880 [Spirochaetia bacterium]|nr:hypothetical protein FACS1894147_11880 [Spirochaetia bacterium]
METKTPGQPAPTFESVWALTQENAAEMKEIAQRFKETDLKFKETTLKFEKNEKRFEKMHEEIFGIGKSNGMFAEEYFFNSLEEKPVFGGTEYDHAEANVKAYYGKVQDEFDIVLYNGNAVAIIEVKYKVQKSDVNKMVSKKVSNFRTLFPQYEKHDIYLGLGGMCFDSGVERSARELGIGLLQQVGDAVEVKGDYEMKAY